MTKQNNKQKEIKQWLENIADNHNADSGDIYSELIDMAQDLDLDFANIDYRWQYWVAPDIVTAELLYTELLKDI